MADDSVHPVPWVFVVATRRDGSAVLYAVTDPEIAELLAVARRIRTKLLSDQLELLSDEDTATPSQPTGASSR